MKFHLISPFFGAVLILASASQAQQKPEFPLGVRLSQPADLCSIGNTTCLAPSDLGLPGAANGLIVPEASVPAIREMERVGGAAQALAYTQGVSDKSILDICTLCGCCVIENESLALEPRRGKDPGLPAGMTVILER